MTKFNIAGNTSRFNSFNSVEDLNEQLVDAISHYGMFHVSHIEYGKDEDGNDTIKYFFDYDEVTDLKGEEDVPYSFAVTVVLDKESVSSVRRFNIKVYNGSGKLLDDEDMPANSDGVVNISSSHNNMMKFLNKQFDSYFALYDSLGGATKSALHAARLATLTFRLLTMKHDIRIKLNSINELEFVRCIIGVKQPPVKVKIYHALGGVSLTLGKHVYSFKTFCEAIEKHMQYLGIGCDSKGYETRVSNIVSKLGKILDLEDEAKAYIKQLSDDLSKIKS